MRVTSNCVVWVGQRVGRAAMFCLGLGAMLALVVVLATLGAVVVVATAFPTPTLLAAHGRKCRRDGPGRRTSWRFLSFRREERTMG